MSRDKISPKIAKLARAALRKLPKLCVLHGARAFRKRECGCFVTQAMGADPGSLRKDEWRRFAERYGMTYNDMFLANAEQAELTALSVAFECHEPWLKRAARTRLGSRGPAGATP